MELGPVPNDSPIYVPSVAKKKNGAGTDGFIFTAIAANTFWLKWTPKGPFDVFVPVAQDRALTLRTIPFAGVLP